MVGPQLDQYQSIVCFCFKRMKSSVLIVVFGLAAVASAGQFGRQQAPAESSGCNYPKPSGYQYPKPEQGLPEEEPAAIPTYRPPNPTTERPVEEPTTQNVDAEAVAEADINEAQADQLKARPQKIVVQQQPLQFQRLVYYPVVGGSRLQQAPLVEQYAVAPETSGFAYSTQVFQQW